MQYNLSSNRFAYCELMKINARQHVALELNCLSFLLILRFYVICEVLHLIVSVSLRPCISWSSMSTCNSLMILTPKIHLDMIWSQYCTHVCIYNYSVIGWTWALNFCVTAIVSYGSKFLSLKIKLFISYLYSIWEFRKCNCIIKMCIYWSKFI